MHPIYYQLNLRLGGNTFFSAALSVSSLLHAAYLWHTMPPHHLNSFLQQIWRWCAELCTLPSAFVPLVTSSLIRSTFSFLLYFTWTASPPLIRPVDWFLDWQAGGGEGVKARWWRWKAEGGGRKSDPLAVWSTWSSHIKYTWSIYWCCVFTETKGGDGAGERWMEKGGGTTSCFLSG